MSESEPTFESSVVVPAARAAVTAVSFAAAAIGAALFWPPSGPLEVGALVLCIVPAPAWLLFAKQEAARHAPPAPPQPARTYAAEAQTITHHVMADWNDGHAGTFFDLSEDQFSKFGRWAVDILQGVSLGENHWTGRDAIFSKGEYHRMLALLQKRGILERVSDKQNASYKVTGPGGAVLRYAARCYEQEYKLPSPVPAGWPRLVRKVD